MGELTLLTLQLAVWMRGGSRYPQPPSGRACAEAASLSTVVVHGSAAPGGTQLVRAERVSYRFQPSAEYRATMAHATETMTCRMGELPLLTLDCYQASYLLHGHCTPGRVA